MRFSANLIRVGSPFLVLILLLGACGSALDSPHGTVQAAAQAFAKGYDARNLGQFDTFFATPAQGGNAIDLSLTREAAHKLVDEAPSGATFKIGSFEILSERVDDANGQADVSYRASVSIQTGSTVLYAATVEQQVALTLVDGQWLISGGQQPVVNLDGATPAP